jgi:phenylpropionate dioxygenase-like ring-hydroxylating dioxygenase large terminal subunit
MGAASLSESTVVTPIAGEGPVRRIRSGRYLDPEFAERERERVFGQSWIAAGFAYQLARPGDYLVFDELGESVIVLRDDDGALRAYHNTCRHRGSSLLKNCGRVDAISCPYHGWTYGLNGDLTAVPKEGGFERLRPGTRGLMPVAVDEWAGFAWIHLGDAPPPLRSTLGSLVDELAPYALEDMRPVHRIEEVMPANWKAMLENAMDFYHVPFVHKGTVQKHVQQGPDLTVYGEHTRQRLHIAPYRWRERLDRRCTRGGPYSASQISSLHKYLLFPNFLINVLPYHLTVMQAFPRTPDTCTLRYSFCKRRGARGIELARVYGTWAASRYILREDRAILERFQEGLASRRMEYQILHEEESAAGWFHGTLNRRLAGT